LRFLAAYGNIHNFLQLLAVRFSTSCVSNVLAGKPTEALKGHPLFENGSLFYWHLELVFQEWEFAFENNSWFFKNGSLFFENESLFYENGSLIFENVSLH